MGGWSQREYAELLEALSQEDTMAAWEAGLRVMKARGVASCKDSDLAPTLTIRAHGRKETLALDLDLDEATRALLGAALKTALLRVVEEERHVQAAQRGAEAEERSAMLSQAAFEGLLIHNDGVVIDVNDRLTQMLGFEREELLGPGTIAKCVAREDQPEVLARIRSGYEGAYVITGVRKDGSRFAAELQSKQGRLGARPVRIAAVRDVAERERMLGLLRESENRLRELANTVFDLTVLSREGVIIAADGPFLAELGYCESDFVGQGILKFVAKTARPLTQQQIQGAKTGAYPSAMVDVRGDSVPVEIVAVETSVGGQAIRIAGVRDLRDARKLEREREQLQRRVEQAQRLDSLGALAGGIAHDFNNLLTTIMGNVEALMYVAAAQGEQGRERGCLDAIATAAESAGQLTKRLLAYAGRGEVGPHRKLDVGQIIEELKPLTRLKPGCVFESRTDPGCFVIGDHTSLTQVLLNLLTNAADAMKAGDRISVRVTRVITPDARWEGAIGVEVRPGDWVMIEVEDTGEGMDVATVSRIFEPFFSTKPEGHGLGLAATLGIIKSHGGALHVVSQPRVGTTFSVLLPASSPAAERIPEERFLARPARSSESCRVLLVDDEATIRAQLKRSLHLRGFVVSEAESGGECLAILEQHSFDVVLLDLSMPRMDGVEVIARMRGQGYTLPIVLMSDFASSAHEKRLEDGAFQAFLRKPFGIAELLDSIALSLDHHANSAPNEPAIFSGLQTP